MTDSVFIVANGARTPLGLGAAQSAAALRAGISGVEEHRLFINRPWTLRQAALDPELETRLIGRGRSIHPDCLIGPGRLLALARSALSEACAPLKDSLADRLRLPLYVGLPEFRPGFAAQDAEAVRTALGKPEGLPVEISEVSVFPDGHAAGLLALATAVERLRRGAFDVCLVGGVDSYFHPDTMDWLDKNRQLAGGDARSAFVPGEGAGFALLVSARVKERLGVPLMRVLATATGKETKLIKTEDVCLGEGLTKTVQSAIDSLGAGQKINDVICDVNGERYRGEEWGFVCLRLSQYFDDPTAYVSPADCWGDLGAASAPLFAILACQAAQHGYAKGPRTMLSASSEHGLRGVAVLEDLKKSER
jgi:3-oxoacyl-[acyl-carrier-protein] synthase I